MSIKYNQKQAKEVKDMLAKIAGFVLREGLTLGEISVSAEIEEESYKVTASIGKYREGRYEYTDSLQADGDAYTAFWYYGEHSECLESKRTSYALLEAKNEDI